ncbi:MAG: hypothetical protein ACRD5H_09085 [Nitrososphaerales archaeon]
MQTYKLLLSAVLICLSLGVLAFGDSTNKKWSLEISLERDRIKMYEPIWLDVELTNISKDSTRSWGLAPPCQDVGIEIELTDSAGNLLTYNGPIYELVPLEGFLILPKEKFYDSFELLHLFGQGEDVFRFRRLAVGKYYINASYDNVKSQRIFFRIIELSESEKNALQLAIEAANLAGLQPRDSNNTILFSDMIDISTNLFAQIACLGTLGWNMFLESFPNSGYTKTALQDQTRGLSKEEKKAYLEAVMIKYKGTRAARHAEQALKLLEK